MDGPQVPAGEVYVAHEGANGELGFFLVSDGSGTRTRCTCARRASCTWAGVHRCSRAISWRTSIPTFGSINMIGGECDR